jgi:hypothetical protein
MRSQSIKIAVAALIVVVVGLILYLPRTAVTPQESDGAEFAAAAVTGGVVHPPGYPVYMFLCDQLVRCFPDNPYAVLAVFSAVLQTAALGLIAVISFLLIKNIYISIAVAVALAVYEPFIRTATDVEVFAFHNFLTALIILLSVILFRCNKNYLFWTAGLGLLFGLGAAHQQMIILWLPLVIIVIFASGYRKSGIKGIFDAGLIAVLAFCAGILPYLSLVGRYQAAPDSSFISIRNFNELAACVLRLGYGTFSLKAGSGASDVSYLFHFLENTAPVLPVFLASLLILLPISLIRNNLLLIGLVLCFCMHLEFAYLLILPVGGGRYHEWIMRFYSPIALSAGISFAGLCSLRKYDGKMTFIIVALVLVPPLLGAPAALRNSDARSDAAIESEISLILEELPQDSVFITSKDRLAFGLAYKQLVQRKRKDVSVIITGLLPSRSYQERIKAQYPFLDHQALDQNLTLSMIADKSYESGRLVFSHFDLEPPPKWKLSPVGVVWQWYPVYDLPSDRKVLRQIFTFCSKWNDSIVKISPDRRRSVQIIQEVFEAPFIWALEHKLGRENPAITEVLNHFRAREINAAAALCQKQIINPDSWEK